MFIFADMDKETYEKQKAFAGEKRSSMKRRYVGHDYTKRGIYMLTMTVEGRRPLFGRVYGSSDGEGTVPYGIDVTHRASADSRGHQRVEKLE